MVAVNPDRIGNDLPACKAGRSIQTTRINGGGERDRTDDLLRARQALSQLSYTPNFAWATKPGSPR